MRESTLSAAMTLREAFHKVHQTTDHSKTYVEDIEKALDHWERCTSNPEIGAIDHQAMHEFKNSFLSRPLPPRSPKSKIKPRPPSPATCFKVLRTLNAILATCGPSQHGNKYGRGIITTIPCTRPPKVDEPEVIVASLEEVSAIYEHCSVATWPRGPVDAVAWWRCLVVYLYNIGSRKNDLLQLRQTQINLETLELRDRQQKNDKSEVKPINETLATHLRSIWLPARTRVFDCPRSKKLLYGQWHKIQAAAGIVVDRPEGSNRKPYYGFHEMRKTCGTELLMVSPIAAQFTMGHSDLKTTQKHYGNRKRMLEQMRPASDALPQPAAFQSEATPTPPETPSPFFQVALAAARKAKADSAGERPVLRVVG